jgi:hypothetical protein
MNLKVTSSVQWLIIIFTIKSATKMGLICIIAGGNLVKPKILLKHQFHWSPFWPPAYLRRQRQGHNCWCPPSWEPMQNGERSSRLHADTFVHRKIWGLIYLYIYNMYLYSSYVDKYRDGVIFKILQWNNIN